MQFFTIIIFFFSRNLGFPIFKSSSKIIFSHEHCLRALGAIAVSRAPALLGWGEWQAVGQAISEGANNGDVRLPAGPWQSGWWEGEDQGMEVIA